jgi:hypothetical protein
MITKRGAAFFWAVLSVYAFAEPPRRAVEFGADAGIRLANNASGIADIFKKSLEIDLNKAGDAVPAGGFRFGAGLNANFFFKARFAETWGFGLSSGVSGNIGGGIDRSLFTFLSEGNMRNHSFSGDITVYGGVFADVTADFYFLTLRKRLRVGVAPALYMPLLYIPKSSIHYRLKAEDAFAFNARGTIAVYSPFSLETMGPDFGELLNSAGFDISLNAEYALLRQQDAPFLDIGGSLGRIPFIPGSLKNKMSVSVDFAVSGDRILQGEMEIPDLELKRTYHGDAKYVLVRPMRVEGYVLFRPFKSYFMTLRPNVGFTILNPAEEFWFNAGADVQVNYRNLLIVHIGTGYEETLWKHRLGFAVNLRFFELALEAGMESQAFLNSFLLNGCSLGIGLRFGF